MNKIEEQKFRKLIKIEKKVARLLEGGCYLEYFEGIKKDELNDTPYKIRIAENPLREVAKYITTLLKEERKKAVEDFAEWLRWHMGTGSANAVPVENPVIWKDQYFKEEISK